MKSPLVLAVALATAILLVYSSVYCSGTFGVNDDYQYLQRVYTGTFDPAHNEQNGMGRQAAAWLLDAGYALCAGSVGNLVRLRLISLVGICLFSTALYRIFRRAGQDQTMALTATLCVAFSPACGVYAAWGAAVLSPYALTLCLLAGRWLQELPADRRWRWLRCAAAAGLILLACSMWQAAAPIALFAAFADAWNRSRPGAPAMAAVKTRSLPSAGMIVGGSVVAYLLAERLAVRLGWVHGSGLERLTVAVDLRAKFWLFGELLRSGFAWWARLHSLAWEVPVAGFVALACGTTVFRPGSAGDSAGRLGRRTGLAAGMVLASIAPLLAASENNAAFRTLPVLYTTMAFLAVEGVARWVRGGPAWLKPAAGGALAALLGLCASYHVRAGIVGPNVREYRAVSKLVQRQFRERPTRLVYLVPSPVLLAPDSMKASWEYGLVSSPFWWVTKPFLLDIFRAQKLGPNPQAADLEIFYREVGHADLPVLNPMPEMLREPGTWRDDAHLGRVLTFSHGWVYSPWFGYLGVREFPIIQHHTMGALLYIGGQPDEIWLHKEGLGNFLAAKKTFPSLYVNERHDWVYLLDTDRARCAVRDAAGRQWPLLE